MKKGYSKKNGLMCFFFIEERGKPFCLKCKRPLAVMKKENLKRHYETNHPEFKNLDGELRKMKIEEFKKNTPMRTIQLKLFNAAFKHEIIKNNKEAFNNIFCLVRNSETFFLY